MGVCRASQAEPAASAEKQTLSPHSKSKAGGLRGPTGQRTGKTGYKENISGRRADLEHAEGLNTLARSTVKYT